jgi:hypothetical protein
MKNQNLTLSPDQLSKAMNLTIRGTTGPWQAATTPLDMDWAVQVFQPEIDLLNQLKIPKTRVSAGIIAAGLLMASIDPGVLTVLERFSRGKSVHDERGFDAPGYLMHLMRRVTEIDSFGRNPVYQHYLFQIALAVLLQWLKDQDNGIESRFLATPPAPPLGELLEKVRRLKGQLPTPRGFRPVDELQGRVPALGPLVIAHPLDQGLILSMVYEAADAEGLTVSRYELAQSLDELMKRKIPEELANPGILAAAVIDHALHPQTQPQWDLLWNGGWREDETGRDMAGRVFKKIRDTNRLQLKRQRNKSPDKLPPALKMTIDLYRSGRDAADMARQKRCANMRWTSSPQASDIRAGKVAKALTQRWADLEIPKAPELAFMTFAPVGATPPPPAQVAAVKRAMGNRQETGRLAEHYFQAHHASIDPVFEGECIDMTTAGKGHDFQTVSVPGGRKWIETKGTAGPDGGVEMTMLEWEMALKKGDDYYLVIVRNLAAIPYTEVYQNPAVHLKAERRPYVKEEVRMQISHKLLKAALKRYKNNKKQAKNGKKVA